MQSLLCHSKSAACVMNIIINVTAVSCTPKQIDLHALFITTAALLCQRVIVNNGSCTIQTRYYLAPPQSILTKQI